MENTASLKKPSCPVMIVEDTPHTMELLVDICSDMGIKTVTAENGVEALAKLKEEKYSVFIVDLMMPVMDGKTFIPLLKKEVPDAVIVVQTALSSAETVIEVMKLGVFDYIIKPIDPGMLQATLAKALEYRYLKDFEYYQKINAGKKIRSQMDWLLYKENVNIADKKYSEIKSIHNLREYMTQGAGIGSIIPLVDVLKNMIIDDGSGSYIVNKDLIDFIIQNNDHLRTQIDGLNSITRILDYDIELEESSVADVYKMTESVINDMKSFFSKKNIRVSLSDFNDNLSVSLNQKYMQSAIEELLVNAYKYSQNNTTVNIFSHISQGYFWLSVKNDVEKKAVLSDEESKLVVEPFYRKMPPDETISEFEKFGFGLGLTVVDNIARKHGGSFNISSVKDHTANNVKDCVLSEMIIPVKQN